MKSELEREDIEAIAQRVVEVLKPLMPRVHDTHAQDEILDVPGLCKYLLVSKQWVYERTHLNEIPHIKKDGLLRFRRSDIDSWLSQSKVPSTAPPRKPFKTAV